MFALFLAMVASLNNLYSFGSSSSSSPSVITYSSLSQSTTDLSGHVSCLILVVRALSTRYIVE
ncbi:hypothetical protein KC19_VG253700 [Ceratodon purpureus]|uniref:Secreted protein n=1 Tax=Ceratodon purpureus TaxID=3225 RepID=A0A8T0HTZ5_CERPU|nr:hypothetical protein KC19_VG253700 [Ceratodon purpureus]